MKYCLDANTLIEAHRRYYALETFPVFWSWLLENTETLGSIGAVYRELTFSDDTLSDWAKTHKQSGFFRFDDEDEAVQLNYIEVVNTVNSDVHYSPEEKANFLRGADPWLIAYATTHNLLLITHERKVGPGSKKVKIPNVCEAFQVECIDTFTMLRQAQAVFPPF